MAEHTHCSTCGDKLSDWHPYVRATCERCHREIAAIWGKAMDDQREPERCPWDDWRPARDIA